MSSEVQRRGLSCTPEVARDALRNLWISVDSRMELRDEVADTRLMVPGSTRASIRPLARVSPFQWEVSGIENPLWKITSWMPAEDDDCWCTTYPKPNGYFSSIMRAAREPLYELNVGRQGLCETYSYALFTPGDAQWFRTIVGKRAIVELGAGRGYWAWQLKQHGFEVAAYDPLTPGEDNEYFTMPGRFTCVLRRDHTAVDDHPDKVLLMVWPGYGANWAADALKRYRGDMLVYAGEGFGGCTADDEFYEVLERDWEWLSTSDSHVTWWGIHDQLQAYVRKPRTPVSLTKTLAITAS